HYWKLHSGRYKEGSSRRRRLRRRTSSPVTASRSRRTSVFLHHSDCSLPTSMCCGDSLERRLREPRPTRHCLPRPIGCSSSLEWRSAEVPTISFAALWSDLH